MKKLKTFFLKKFKSRVRKLKSRHRGIKRKKVTIFLLVWRLVFGGLQPVSANSNTFQNEGKSQTEISRVLEQKSPSMKDFNQEGSVQPEQVLKGTQGAQTALKIPSGGSDNTSSPSSQPSKFSAGSKAKGAAARNIQRRRSRRSSGSLFAESFSPKPLYGSRPMPQPGNFNIPKPPSVRCSAKLDDMGFTGYLKPGESKSMETLSQTLSQEYTEYQQKFNSPPVSKRFDTKNYDQEKFKELSKDPNAKKTVFHKTTVDEARSALHAEMEGHIENPQRLDQSFTKSVDLDFKVDGPYPFTHVDIKHPVGSEILQKQNSPMDLETMAYKMGGKLVDQKNRFCNLEQGPKTSENVLHIVDLAYVPSHEKEIIKEYCLKGAEDAGGSEGILFLNDNDA